MKVFIADDSDLLVQKLQESILAIGGITIAGTSNNGLEALDKMIVLKPDLAVLDINMPGLNGLEVLQEIRKVDKKMKIIILTLHASFLYRERALRLGADYFFSKSDEFEKVSSVLAEIKTGEHKT